MSRYLKNIPLLALLTANTIPLLGVSFFNWDAFSVVILYWAETFVIGFYNALRMMLTKDEPKSELFIKLLDILFFILPFLLCITLYGFFILILFQKDEQGFLGQPSWPSCCLSVFANLFFGVIKHAFSVMPENVKYALAAFFISHGTSFVSYYIFKKEFLSTDIHDLQKGPYSRVLVMHFAIFTGAIVMVLLRTSVVVLPALVVFKTIIDARLHLREHRAIRLCSMFS